MLKVAAVVFFLSQAAFAGEMKLKDAEGASFRRTFSVCDSKDEKCANGKCKLTLTKLSCERNAEENKANCTFQCNGGEHMHSDDQAESIFKALSAQKKLVKKTDKTEAFKDVTVNCDAMTGDNAAVCKVKHASIK